MKKILSLLMALCLYVTGYAQCTDCGSADVVIDTNISSDYVFQSNTNYCINGNITIQWHVYFGDNVNICIPTGSSLLIDNQMLSSNTYPSSNEVTWNVSGTLIIPNVVPVSFNLNINEGGEVKGINGDYQDLNIYGDFINLTLSESASYTFGNTNLHNSGTVNTFTNNGIMHINGEIATLTNGTSLAFYNYGEAILTGNLNFNTGGGNLFINEGTFSCNGLYSTDPTLHLKNEGDMTTHGNYDDTVGSFFSNCGTLHMSQNWSNLQGTIINTGEMTVIQSSIAFASTGKVENYSNMTLQGITMGNGGAFYNEGYVEFTSNAVYDVKLYGPTSNNQPEHSNSENYGQFVLFGTSNGGAIIKGNLNFLNNNGPSTQSSCFGTIINIDPSVTFGNCSNCTVITEYDQCANADGTWPVLAQPLNTIPVNRNVRSYFN